MYELHVLHDHGVFLRRDALAHGYQDRDLKRAVDRRELVRVRHGAYLDTARWNGLNDVGRHLAACQAVLLTHEVPHALSHTSGAAIHGMRLWGVDLSRVHVTRLGSNASRKHRDVAYHDCPRDGSTSMVSGVPVLSAAHCALGAASVSSVEAGLVVVDSAYERRLCAEVDLREAYEQIIGYPGTARLQITLRLADGGSQSVGESRMRYLFWRYGVPRPELQYAVHDGGTLVGFTDFAWPDHGLIGEFDGKVKYGDLLRPGETAADAVFREKVREDRIRQVTGWRVIRLTWADLENPERTAGRMRAALHPR